MDKLTVFSLVLLAAGAANAASPGEEDYNAHNRAEFTSSLSRAEVQAQVAEAVRDGTMPEYGEDSSAFAINNQAGSPTDVGAVREEAYMAARTHVIQELMV